MRASLGSTPLRTFVLFPAAVLLEHAASGRPLHLRYLPLLPWGYLQYRWSGRYRTRVGGGGPGIQVPPDRLVTTGPYAWTRNPMYLGHLIFMSGLYLLTRSPVALALVGFHIAWFEARARDDERRLELRFGQAYQRYQREVPRWVGLPGAPSASMPGADGTTRSASR